MASSTTVAAQAFQSIRFMSQPAGPSFYVVNPTSITKNNKFQLLVAEVNTLKPDIIVICESWLKKTHADSLFTIDNYFLLRRDRSGRRGGGVCVYINTDYILQEIDNKRQLSNGKRPYETLWQRVVTPNNQSFILCAIYHPPRTSKTPYSDSELLTDMENNITCCLAQYPSDFIIVTGDINKLPFDNVALNCGLVQIVDQPTHGTNILDKFYTNRPDLFNCEIVNSVMKTKHKTVLVNCAASRPSQLPSDQILNRSRFEFCFYDTRQHHLDKLLYAMMDVHWMDIIYYSDDIDDVYTRFVETCQALISTHIPERKVTLGPKDPHFVSPLVKSLLRKRNRLMRKGKISAAESLRQKIDKLIRENRQKLMERANDGDVKALWQAVKISSAGRKQNFFSADNPTLLDVEKLNEYFTQIATDPEYRVGPILKHVCNNESDISELQVESTLPRISVGTVLKLLAKIKKTSPGSDGIPYWFFKKFSHFLAPIISRLYNRILTGCIMPSQWKHAIVTPVPKTPKPKDFNELRPISVTPLLSRIFEKILVKKYIAPAITKESLQNQFAFKTTGSTTAALVNIYHRVTALLEHNAFVHLLSIDFSKAFDTINHEILLNKLSKTPIHPRIVSLIASFLLGRTQSTKLGNYISRPLPISLSIVQGSGLGPYLYIIFKTDLKTLTPENELFLYADDTDLLIPETSPIEIAEEFQNILRWAENNKMRINKAKTKQLIFRRPNLAVSRMPTLLPTVEVVECLKTLGIYLQCSLNQTEQVNFILGLANQRLYLLKILKQNNLKMKELDCLFASLIVSRIAYAIEAWGRFVTSDLECKINKMFRTAKKWGITTKLVNFQELRSARSSNYFQKICRNENHALYHLLPPERNLPYELRERQHSFRTIKAIKDLHRQSFLVDQLMLGSKPKKGVATN